MTPNEQYSHVSLWCLVSAPLILSGDITRLDAFTLCLLSNDEVLDVDQDPLGKAALRMAKDGDSRSLGQGHGRRQQGGRAVQSRRQETAMTVQWSEVGVRGKQAVRDLWRQKDLGAFEDRFSAPVGRHGVVLIRLRAAESFYRHMPQLLKALDRLVSGKKLYENRRIAG